MIDAERIVLAVRDISIEIDVSAGARATSWRVGDLELLTRYGADPVEGGMYPMAPWAGRVRGNAVQVGDRRVELPASYGSWALHGTVQDQPLRVMEHDQRPDRALLVARASEHPAWPWPMEVDVAWELRRRVLTTTITVRALEESFPVVVGWHPWFARHLARGREAEWSMRASSRAERGQDYLPTGRLVPYRPADGPFDDAFHLPDGCATVRWPGALRLDIVSEAQWYVIFDQLAAAVCIEPQSGPPNGINDGLGQPIAVARPGEPHRLVTVWRMLDDPPVDRV